MNLYSFFLSAILLFFSSLSFAEDRLPNIEDWKDIIQSDTIFGEKILFPNIKNLQTREDSINAISSLNKLGQIYCNRVNYGKSYDCYWKALLLSEQLGDDNAKARSYDGLGVLYSIYERPEQAYAYFQKSLTINRNQRDKTENTLQLLLTNYYALAVHFRYQSDIKNASIYLDSCQLVSSKLAHYDQTYLKAERAYLLSMQGKYTEAEKQLISLEQHIIHKIPNYKVIYYSLLGELYHKDQQYRKARHFYQNAILEGKKRLKNVNFLPEVYYKLANVNKTLGDYKIALSQMETAMQLDQLLYSSRNTNNKYFLEIRDEFRLSQEKQTQKLQQQHILNLEQEDRIWELKTSLLAISILFLLITYLIWRRKLQHKHLAEQRILKEQQQAQLEKNREIMLVKNKELTNSTLQVIVKNELLDEIKEELHELKKRKEIPELQKVINKIKLNKDVSWLEFENRFTAVNSDFFDKLKIKYPHLKPYDLKICALIKLNFTGKEMAKLLGISPESANTSRYRLRKRLGLERDINLTEFIDSI